MKVSLALSFKMAGFWNENRETFSFLYCILSFGVRVQNMLDSCIDTHMAVCSAAFLPFTHIWHFSPGYPSPKHHVYLCN